MYHYCFTSVWVPLVMSLFELEYTLFEKNYTGEFHVEEGKIGFTRKKHRISGRCEVGVFNERLAERLDSPISYYYPRYSTLACSCTGQSRIAWTKTLT